MKKEIDENLITAVTEKHQRIMHLLILAGANLNQLCDDEDPLLFKAFDSCDREIMNTLFENYTGNTVDQLYTESKDRTVVHVAIRTDLDLVK